MCYYIDLTIISGAGHLHGCRVRGSHSNSNSNSNSSNTNDNTPSPPTKSFPTKSPCVSLQALIIGILSLYL